MRRRGVPAGCRLHAAGRVATDLPASGCRSAGWRAARAAGAGVGAARGARDAVVVIVVIVSLNGLVERRQEIRRKNGVDLGLRR